MRGSERERARERERQRETKSSNSSTASANRPGSFPPMTNTRADAPGKQNFHSPAHEQVVVESRIWNVRVLVRACVRAWVSPRHEAAPPTSLMFRRRVLVSCGNATMT